MMRAAALVLSLAAGPAAAQAGEDAIIITPFVVFDGGAECPGSGNIAFRATFDAVAPAKLAAANALPSEICTITTRRGAHVEKVPIACPDEVRRNEGLAIFGQPALAQVSGEVSACVGPDRLEILRASWSVSVPTDEGVVAATGGRASPGVIVNIHGPIQKLFDRFGRGCAEGWPTIITLVWDNMPVAAVGQNEGTLGLSTYVALASRPVELGRSLDGTCQARTRTVSAADIVTRDPRAQQVVDRVELE